MANLNATGSAYFEQDDTFVAIVTGQEMRQVKRKYNEREVWMPQLTVLLELKERLTDPSRPRGKREAIPEGVDRNVKVFVSFWPVSDAEAETEDGMKKLKSLAKALNTLGVGDGEGQQVYNDPTDFAAGEDGSAPNIILANPAKEQFVSCSPSQDSDNQIIWWNLKNYNLTENSAALSPEVAKNFKRSTLGRLKKIQADLRQELADKQANRASGNRQPVGAGASVSQGGENIPF